MMSIPADIRRRKCEYRKQVKEAEAMSYDSLESRDEAFYGASLEELKRGYKETGTEVQCLICGEIYEKGEVFPRMENIMMRQKGYSFI